MAVKSDSQGKNLKSGSCGRGNKEYERVDCKGVDPNGGEIKRAQAGSGKGARTGILQSVRKEGSSWSKHRENQSDLAGIPRGKTYLAREGQERGEKRGKTEEWGAS